MKPPAKNGNGQTQGVEWMRAVKGGKTEGNAVEEKTAKGIETQKNRDEKERSPKQKECNTIEGDKQGTRHGNIEKKKSPKRLHY